ncbi:MAG: DUF1669 domain-containing protein [Oscillochloris sp.]|nr:DUF1669 domain-containing protein [Oscillochloris sp.]
MAHSRRPTKQRHAQSRATWLGLVIVVGVITFGYLVQQGYIDLSAVLARIGVDPAAVGLPVTPEPAVSSGGDAGAIEVFFTTPHLIYPDVAANRIAPPHERALLADLNSAARTLDLALYEYDLPSIAAALVQAQSRGVEVRLALDRENLDDPEMAEWAGMVEAAGIPIAWETSDAFQHSKFVIVDQRLVWTGSWNATINDTYRNNNNLLRITLPAIVANYQAEFERFFSGTFSNSKSGDTPYPAVRLGNISIENYFSPRERVAPQVINWIDRARTSVHFLAFSFTSDDVGDALIRRRQAGIVVRGVFERRNANGIGSEYDRLRNNDVAALSDGNCYTMHHKVIVIDSRIVITGSYNFTGRAEDVNDENLLIIDDPLIAQAFEAEFARVYQQAQTPLRCG